MEHLYQKLMEYNKSDFYPYHMPGHKRTFVGDMSEDIIGMDITEIDGFDNLHDAQDILKELQAKAATLYGAEESFYLVNGSTGGILSAISATLPKSGHLLMSRNCHKSAYHAAYLRNLKISYLYPSMLLDYDICDAITPKQVKEALDKEPDIDAVFLVSPTYEGILTNVAQIADIVHERGIPLIIDEAHGAHLGLAEGFAKNSNQAGADLVIHSVHKTLPAMTQTALLHVNGNRIDRERLRRFLHIYQSSSPSYVLMASIDNALHSVEKDGVRLFAEFKDAYLKMRKKLAECKRLRFLPLTLEKQDIGKLVIDCKNVGISGQKLYNILLEKYHLQLEMAGESYCLAMFTVADGREAYDRMTNALLEMDEQMTSGTYEELIQDSILKMKEMKSPIQAVDLTTAWDMPWEMVALSEAVDRTVADFVNLYPPGVPLLVPGEVFSKEHYLQILEYLRQGLNVQGIYTENKGDLIKCIR